MIVVLLFLFVIVESSKPDCFNICYDTGNKGRGTYEYLERKECKPWISNCDVQSCTVPTEELCLSNILNKTTTTKVTVSWSDSNADEVGAYIVLLYNDKNICEKYEYQASSHGTKTFYFNNYIFSSCKLNNPKKYSLTYRTTFDELQYNKEYTIYIVTVALSHNEFVMKVPTKTQAQECFQDCYDSDYLGIRTISENGNVCLPWKSTHKNGKVSNFCTMKEKDRPWCITESNILGENCKVRKCKNSQKDSECLLNVDFTTSTKVSIKWNHPRNTNEVYSYVILLYDREYNCESYMVQCDRCSISRYIMGFILSCKSKLEIGKVTYSHVFNDLKPDNTYMIYHVTVSKEESYQNINKIFVQTKEQELVKPSNVIVANLNLHSLSFQWDNEENIKFVATLSKVSTNSKIRKHISNGKVEFLGLDVCTEYCLIVVSEQNGKHSDPSDIICLFTSSPAPGTVIINDIGYISSSTKIISWTYNDRKECSIYFQVEYSYLDGFKKADEETNQTNFLLTNLDNNKIYKVRVRAKTNMTKDNIKYGPYSKTKFMQIVSGTPVIEQFKENITGFGSEVNVYWTMVKYNLESIFEYMVVLKSSTNQCLGSANLVCSSCKEEYNMTYSEDVERFKKRFNCIKKILYFKKEQHSFYISMLKKTNLKRFKIHIYAITLENTYEIYYKNTFIGSHVNFEYTYEDFLDLDRVFNMQNKNNITKYNAKSQDSNVKISKSSKVIDKINLKCIIGKVVNLEVYVENNNKIIKVPFNISCGLKHPTNIIRNLTNKYDKHFFNIFWNVTQKSSHKYIVTWMNNENYTSKYLDTELTSYSLKVARTYNWQQMCIATIDDKWSTSKYSCTQYSLYPGPIIKLKVYSTSREIYLDWQKSHDDIHNGYIINFIEPNGLCKSTLINMESFCVKSKHNCRYMNKIRWRFLKSFQIKSLTPDTEFKIKIYSIKGIYESEPTIISVKTKKEESVSDLKVRGHGLNVSITFSAPRRTENMQMSYRIKLTLHGINMCTFKYKVIYDDIINNTSKLIFVHYSVNCFKYEVVVTPRSQCNKGESLIKVNGSDIEYTPSIIQGFFKNMTHQNSNMSNIKVKLLSLSLLKVSWSYDILNNECYNYGFLVDLVQENNKDECNSWVVAVTTCTTMNNDLNELSKCKKKEYIRYDNDVIKLNMFLRGEFKDNKSYNVNIWRIGNNITLIHKSVQKYESKGECITDCQIPILAGLSQDSCNVVQTKINSMRFNYRNNICWVGRITVQYCYDQDLGHTPNCRTNACVSRSDECLQNIVVLSFENNITIKLPELTQRSETIGYILELLNLNNTCIKRNMINLRISNVVALTNLKNCMETNTINFFNSKSNFTKLPAQKEYTLYIYSVLFDDVFGVISKLRVATTLTAPMLKNYIATTKRTNTSLKFEWNSYRDKNNKGFLHHYMAHLVNTRTNEEFPLNVKTEMVEFTKLEVCTRYCIFLTIVYMNNLLEQVDSTCDHTLSSNLGILTLNDIESSPILSRDISWTYSGNEDCPKTYVVEIYSKYQTFPDYENTNNTQISIKNLKINRTYRVKVGFKKDTLKTNYLDNINYSDMKIFYTGTVLQTILVRLVRLDSSKKKLEVIWKIFDQSESRMFEFIIQIRNAKQKCLASILVTPSSGIQEYQPLLSYKLMKYWRKYRDCPTNERCTFKLSEILVDCESEFKNALNDSFDLAIYGLSVLGIKQVHRKSLLS